MFDYLYAKQYAIQRQRDGLFAQERERYLQHCHSTGSTRVTLQVIRRHEQVKRCALEQLGVEIARRAEHQLELVPRVFFELGGHLFEGKFQVCGGCNGGHWLGKSHAQGAQPPKAQKGLQPESSAEGLRWHGRSNIFIYGYRIMEISKRYLLPSV